MENKLKEYLDKRGDTPYEFSKRTGICINTIYRILNGNSIKLKTAKKIKRYTKGEVCEKDLTLFVYSSHETDNTSESCAVECS